MAVAFGFLLFFPHTTWNGSAGILVPQRLESECEKKKSPRKEVKLYISRAQASPREREDKLCRKHSSSLLQMPNSSGE